ncbi:hypothetical protein J2T12_003373 [Paenibacillus anaericanus]|uniref:Uncharacterized protein n=1 Tax=Paenibacillus anaericanus TaxID=170367 RepID=A0A3S1K3C7_9BACL|nr:hypothetical protein [Paenibacillus anaericanus]MDQ0089960.1 hypothetical protein [Paenibacillus anaericanus]RUT42868.1 hypothetical protein EJP82_21805 [Paenibacillus anaericanus]
MFEGFLEMQSVVSRVQGRLEIGGDQAYHKLEYGTERFLHTPEPGNRIRKEEPPQRFSFRRFWS